VAKILVADDNSNIQKMVGLALKDQGIDVVAVGNGEAAVRKIADIHPDLVLADVFMPVRNGYEVCRYVKEDPNFSHIPVILLVGAFDPLDEQEAQRVGADGVLKKPFVPPDPLISMVKSALARAGVQTGPAPPTEKSPEPPPRPAGGLLNPAVNPKHTAQTPEKVAEVAPQPIEDFPGPPEQVRIAAGHEPVAFGTLLETPELEDDPAFLPKGREEIAGRNWGVEETQEAEEVAEEEESPRGGWRNDGHEDVLNEGEGTASRVSDWRDAAFHGDPPAAGLSSQRWTPAVEKPSFAEAAHSPAIAVSTLEEKPADLPTPFSGDAWAAAMAAGVEEKLAEASGAAEATKEPQTSAETTAVVQETVVQEPAREHALHVEEPAKVSETSNGWYSISSSPWDAEAKKASLLAATWDMPTQSVPAGVEHAPVEDRAVPVQQVESHYKGEQAETYVEHHDSAYREHKEQEQVETFAETHETVEAETPEEGPAAEPQAPAVVWRAAQTPAVEALLAGAVPLAAPRSEENTWEVLRPLHAEQFAEVAQEQAPPMADGYLAPTQEQPVVAEETPVEWAPVAETGIETVVTGPSPEAAKPDMDALVARVLEKMNPELLQKMTHEFLRPVIEVIIQDVLNSKNS
jgi:CheY-like chemotaxis protein